jgi:hypothetical protein
LEVAGGAEGARRVTEADALLAAQGIRAHERFAHLYLPELDLYDADVRGLNTRRVI